MLLALAWVPAARAQSPDPSALARSIAAPWPDLQEGTGRLPDFMDDFQTASHEGTRYGDAMMGYGLIQTGLREGDEELVRTGVRAITNATTERWLRPSSFEAMAIGAAYRLMRARAPNLDEFAAARARWEAWMRGFKTTRLQIGNKFGNHWLVDALAVLELQRTGLRSRVKGTVLGSGRSRAKRQAVDLINRGVPRLVPSDREILSDPPDWPVAYHDFSAALYARAMVLIGSRVSAAARRTLGRVMRVAQLTMAPDGDVAYWGRSQQEVWALTSATYAGAVAARMPGRGAATAVDLAVARRALERAAALYPVGPRGQLFIPALAQDMGAAARATDGYVGAPSMSGLALVTLNWLVDDVGGGAPPPGRIPADNEIGAVFSRAAGRFAVVRRGGTWMAVKMTHAGRWYNHDDVRYDFGLQVAKRLTGGGWVDLVPQRPLTAGGGYRSSGPVLLSGGPAYPVGDRIAITPGGRIRVDGAFLTDGGRRRGKVVSRARFWFTPVDCGVEMSFEARAGARYAFDAYFRGGRPAPDPTGAANALQRVTIDPAPAAIGVEDGTFTSAQDAHLHRLDTVISSPTARTVTVRFCGA